MPNLSSGYFFDAVEDMSVAVEAMSDAVDHVAADQEAAAEATPDAVDHVAADQEAAAEATPDAVDHVAADRDAADLTMVNRYCWHEQQGTMPARFFHVT